MASGVMTVFAIGLVKRESIFVCKGREMGRLGPFSENTIVVGDCLDIMAQMPDGCVDLVFADPPYNMGKADWDRGHDWHGWVAEAVRLLKFNGAFWAIHRNAKELAKISDFIEAQGGPPFVNWITWDLFNGNETQQAGGGPLIGFMAISGRRRFQQMAEYLIWHADFGYLESARQKIRDEARGFIFEPIRNYLDSERRRANVSHQEVISHLGRRGHDSHFFSPVQWQMPNEQDYLAMRDLFNRHGEYRNSLSRTYGDVQDEYKSLKGEYKSFLARDYQDLCAEYEMLAPSYNDPGPISSIWQGIIARRNEHPTPKPEWLLERVIKTTSNVGDLIFDPFMGSGTTAVVADRLGRKFFGCDISEEYVEMALERLEKDRAGRQLALL